MLQKWVEEVDSGKSWGDKQSRDPRAGQKEKKNKYQKENRYWEPSERQPEELVPAVPETHTAADQPHLPAAWAQQGCECGSVTVAKRQVIKQWRFTAGGVWGCWVSFLRGTSVLSYGPRTPFQYPRLWEPSLHHAALSVPFPKGEAVPSVSVTTLGSLMHSNWGACPSRNGGTRETQKVTFSYIGSSKPELICSIGDWTVIILEAWYWLKRVMREPSEVWGMSMSFWVLVRIKIVDAYGVFGIVPGRGGHNLFLKIITNDNNLNINPGNHSWITQRYMCLKIKLYTSICILYVCCTETKKSKITLWHLK